MVFNAAFNNIKIILSLESEICDGKFVSKNFQYYYD
jgi:hypothetical protein